MLLRNFREILVELILLSILVGLIPELLVGAMQDINGPCGFDATVCNDIQIQGAIKSVFTLVCMIGAVVVSFFLSKEFKSNEGVQK